MQLEDFVNDLPYNTFKNLRQVVSKRHLKEIADFSRVFEYLKNEKTLKVSARSNPKDTIKVLSQKTKVNLSICTRVVEAYCKNFK